jgi:hypothetical protein
MSKNWCFICQKEFALSADARKECPNCNQDAFEEITASSHPQLFQAYQPSPPPPSTLPPSSTSPTQPPINLNGLFQQLNLQQGLMDPIMGLSSIFSNVVRQPNPAQSQQNQVSSSEGSSPQTEPILNFLYQALPGIVANLPQIISFTSQIFNNLMQNLISSGQSFRRATQAEIDRLEKIRNPRDCGICQGGAQTTEGYRLKCHH